MTRLLLLLPFLALAARMQIEWLWFGQFEWESILLKRWLFQLLLIALALIPLIGACLWSRQFRLAELKQPVKSTLRGYGFGLALVLSGTVVLLSSLVAVNLAYLALVDPFALGHWSERLFQSGHSVGMTIVVPAFALAVAMVWPRCRCWIPRIFSAAMVMVVCRGWGVWFLALTIPDAGTREPFLGADISFGLGRFAAAELALQLVLISTAFTIAFAIWRLLSRSQSISDWQSPTLSQAQLRLLRPMVALILLKFAGLVWLSRHQLLWTQHGLVAGAGWLQEHLTLPLRAGLTVLLIALALVSLQPGFRGVRRGVIGAIAVLLALELTLTPFTRWLIVRPQELDLQAQYLSRAIQATKQGFQLDRMTRRVYEPKTLLTRDDLKTGASTLANVRLWDSAPLLEANRQLQQLRVYYRFSNAAVDRYPLIPSSDTAQQVILSARELDQSALPRRSRTWQNRHFVFTHGYGFTVSPVNTRSNDGLPSYFISDLGSETRIEGNKDLDIKRADVKEAIPVGEAALYYGMLPSPYAVAPTAIQEFDYPEGDRNIETNYRGSGGVPIGTIWRRIAASIYLGEPRLLITPAINSNSHLLIRREVRERVKAIAPFIDFRGDPYLISVPEDDAEADDRSLDRRQHQFWIVEGYTHSSTYPYSSSVNSKDHDRYLRNSVKAVVDAYNGTVQLYVMEKSDPIIQAWQKLFPEILESSSSMPDRIRDHLRVPEDFFNVQINQLKRYHVDDPRIFYNGDDVWQVPVEIYAGKKVDVEPYHITAQVQGNDSSEFLLLQPITPLARPNLTAWLAARNDGSHYGELQLIEFPKDKAVLGPEQVQALIHQDPEVSKVFGLWDQDDLELVQGNLLVLPVGSGLLYVEPVYLRTSKVGLPSLARIVVSDGRSIAMDESLDAAIEQLIKK